MAHRKCKHTLYHRNQGEILHMISYSLKFKLLTTKLFLKTLYNKRYSNKEYERITFFDFCESKPFLRQDVFEITLDGDFILVVYHLFSEVVTGGVL